MARFTAPRTVMTLCAAAALSLGAALAANAADEVNAADAQGSGVSFRNVTDQTVHILARYGSEAKCHRRPETQKLAVEPGQAAEVAASSSVCWCKTRSADSDSCVTDWIETSPGAKLRVR